MTRTPLLPPPTALLEEMLEVARRFGRDPDWVRAGGGNASVKADGVLWIKPSGVPLAGLAADDLVPLAIEPLLALLHANAGAAGGEAAIGSEAPIGGSADADAAVEADPVMRVARLARLAPAAGRRPSVELLFHAFLAGRFVLHTHPVAINALTCAADGAALAARLFGDEAVWVPYTDPGLPLARAIVDAHRAVTQRTGRPAPAVTLLQNHGLIVAAESAAEIDRVMGWVRSVVQAAIDRPAAMGSGARDSAPADRRVVIPADRARELVEVIGPTLRGLLGTDEALKIVTFDGSPAAAPGAHDGEGVAGDGPLTPDQIVYTGSWPLRLDLPDDAGADELPDLVAAALREHRAVRGVDPVIVAVPGLGIFAAGDTWAAADNARSVLLDAMRVGAGARSLGGVRPLADAEWRFIETWEAEAYRRDVAAGSGTPGRFCGRVALVTGAAQGFGLAIASDLVAEGGHVVLADLNAALATENARALEERFGPGRATALAMDVGDESSVAAAVHATVERYGGLDLLVSNAGVLRAGSVTGQSMADFDLVTAVNYRGYFLAVRACAPILARQHRARPAWLGDIIEINSKSGLVGSSRNSAYAGSKFGGIGLTQSFALELVGDGIKVNAICPGNFFDGPLWSDPENGLFRQYLRQGKVPGATTIDDVRRFYEAKVPMGRGCEPADIVKAIHYLVSQQYETGQALPVTGGQVMLA